VLFVDKPAGMSSHDVVGIVRRAARTRRVGHAGTLDPFATGLLVLAVGSVTRLLPYIAGEPKVYDAVIRFGAETDTDDATGKVTREANRPDASRVPTAAQQLTGPLEQVPPSYSAKHVDGQRAYAVARRGGDLQLKPVPVTVHQWDLAAWDGDDLQVRITCAGGTYVRALARDLGRAVGSAAHCLTLRRISSGPAHVDDAVAVSTLMPGAIAEGVVPLRSPLAVLQPMAHEVLDDDALRALSRGRTVRVTQAGARAALLHGADIVGIADRVRDAGQTEWWQPRVVLLGASS
jgi:tRNA pseudouridine55 synthase